MHYIFNIVFIILCMLPSVTAQATPMANSPESCLKISKHTDTSPDQESIYSMITKMYEEAGVCFEWISLSPNRGRHLLQFGGLDGNVARVASFIDVMDNKAFIIPTPVSEVYFSLSSPTDNSLPCSFPKLSMRRIGYYDGIMWMEKHLSTSDAILFPLSLDHDKTLLLRRNRIDAFMSYFFITTKQDRLLFDRKQQQPDRGLYTCYFEPINLHHILHIRHLDKKERLNQALIKLLKE